MGFHGSPSSRHRRHHIKINRENRPSSYDELEITPEGFSAFFQMWNWLAFDGPQTEIIDKALADFPLSIIVLILRIAPGLREMVKAPIQNGADNETIALLNFIKEHEQFLDPKYLVKKWKAKGFKE